MAVRLLSVDKTSKDTFNLTRSGNEVKLFSLQNKKFCLKDHGESGIV